jgi:hypothetical protein
MNDAPAASRRGGRIAPRRSFLVRGLAALILRLGAVEAHRSVLRRVNNLVRKIYSVTPAQQGTPNPAMTFPNPLG